MSTIRESVVQELMSTGKWSKATARLGERADYRCEYCGLDLLATVENYKLWQIDHIIPLKSGGDPTDPDNLAVACKQCNWDFKARWDPRTETESDATRTELIDGVRRYIKERKAESEKELERVRSIVRYGQRS